VVAYLKSAGADRAPVKPLEAGVHSWEDFREVLVKGDVATVAAALAKMIGGKVTLEAYGKSFKLGKKAYAVARPKGMRWCNVLQLAPARNRFDDPQKHEPFCKELAKASGSPVFWAGYSDASDAAAMARFEPNESIWRDYGWDRDTLDECIAGQGDQAPAWMKQKLAEIDAGEGEEVPSTERLEKLAAAEKMVVAAFGLDGAPKKKVEITFAGYPEEMFDGVAFVTD